MRHGFFHGNSLFFKLAASVLTGMVALAVCLSFLNIQVSQRMFTDMFSDAQEKIFGQIEAHFYEFYVDLAEIAKETADAEAVHAYLMSSSPDTDAKESKNTGKGTDANAGKKSGAASGSNDAINTAKEQRITYAMQRRIEQTKIRLHDNVTLVLIGTDGKSYMYSHADIISMPQADIFALPVTKEAARHPGRLVCKYMEAGFTETMKNEPVVVTCRAVRAKGAIIGYVYLLIKEAELRGLYDYFLAGTSDIVVLNRAGEVISTNNPRYFSKEDTLLAQLLEIAAQAKENRVYQASREENGERVNYLVQQFTNTDFVIVGTVNAGRTFSEAFNFAGNIAMAVFMAAGMLVLVFIFVRRQTRPIYRLAASMREQKQRDFNECVPVEGTDEIRELSMTYNEMMADMRRYLDRAVETERAMRAAELHALQMQINPHYIYNTLASIKWLIMQGNSKHSIETLDAFIALLHDTFSNADAFITVRQEEKNLRNYVSINRTRYGKKVHVAFFIQEDCMEAKLPKLALQPFIENAFFHAFPQERYGNINVFIRQIKDRLHIEIADDGIGMTKERINSMLADGPQKEHFTGIGIKNVDERLKLIYGAQYGVRIDSGEGCGTTVYVEVPLQHPFPMF